MSSDDRTAQEQLNPEQRRTLLRAFADRMLLKVSAMEDPEDLPGVERAMRTAAVIERIYSRCDRAERQAPDQNRIEADRARNASDAIKARVELTGIYDWGEDRRKAHGRKWDIVQKHLDKTSPKPRSPQARPAPVRIPATVTKTTQPAPQTAPIQPEKPAKTQTAPLPGLPQKPARPQSPQVTVTDMTDTIHRARAAMGLPDMSAFDTPPDAELDTFLAPP